MSDTLTFFAIVIAACAFAYACLRLFGDLD